MYPNKPVTGDEMKRGRVEIIHSMLSATQKAGGSIKPTHMLYKANLSHDAMKRYTQELIDSEMLEEVKEKSKKRYKITDKGYHFLSEYKRFSELADAFGI